ncbi:MAG: dTDP-4-dehydrorhamnose reductase [Thermodesulfobacteriota bacterium]
MKWLLVIGAKGMLGTDLVDTLRSSFRTDQDWGVMGWDIDEIDIQEEHATVTKIERLQPRMIINLAAYTDVDGCESNEEKAFAVNAEGMRHVVLGASKCGAKVVYLSTDYVFDGEKKEPYLEEDSPHPLSVYGWSKLKGEQYVRELAEDGLIIRSQWLFGRHGKNFVRTILREAREKRMVSIVDDQTGSPTYTVDLAAAISALIQRRARGIFHVVNSDSCTWFAFGQEILRLSGMPEAKIIPISSKELGRPAARPLYSVLGTQKLKREIRMTLRPWAQALREYIKSQMSFY